MKRASYREAVRWIAANDDTAWITEPIGGDIIPSVSACLVADLFGVSEVRLIADVTRALEKLNTDG